MQEERSRQEGLMSKKCLQRPDEQLRREAEVGSCGLCRYSAGQTIRMYACTATSVPSPSLTC